MLGNKRKKGGWSSSSEGARWLSIGMEPPEASASPPVSRDILEFYVVELASPSPEEQRRAVVQLRVLSKWHAKSKLSEQQAGKKDVLNVIADMGALPLLVRLLGSEDAGLQENAVTVLHNLSVQATNKERIIRAKGCLDALLQVVSAGWSMAARENGAALLFSLMVVESFRETVGNHPAGICSLMSLFREGSSRGKKDAVKALFHLSLSPANKGKVVEAGIVPQLLCLLEDWDSRRDKEFVGLVEDALALLAVLSSCREAQGEVVRCGGVPALVRETGAGSPRSKEHAANTLLQLCQHGGDGMVAEVLDDLSVLKHLGEVQTSGTVRGRTKANALLQLLVSNVSY